MLYWRCSDKLRGTAESKIIKMHWAEEASCVFSQMFKCHYATSSLFWNLAYSCILKGLNYTSICEEFWNPWVEGDLAMWNTVSHLSSF